VIGLERSGGEFSRFETAVFPEDHPEARVNAHYVERLVKFLLWQRGGYRLYVGGPRSIGESIRACYAPDGPQRFDYHFMGEQVYERTFEVIPCRAEDVPARAKRAGRSAATWTAAASASTWAPPIAR
jgi:hypothetical protein